PRQGINTCGANDIFFFDTRKDAAGDLVYVANKKMPEPVLLPKRFLFPLITAKQFRKENEPVAKWVLLPYHQNGKPLKQEDVAHYPELMDYLNIHQSVLKNRKGVMLGAMLSGGCWWRLLGVGAYNFFPYKIV